MLLIVGTIFDAVAPQRRVHTNIARPAQSFSSGTGHTAAVALRLRSRLTHQSIGAGSALLGPALGHSVELADAQGAVSGALIGSADVVFNCAFVTRTLIGCYASAAVPQPTRWAGTAIQLDAR